MKKRLLILLIILVEIACSNGSSNKKPTTDIKENDLLKYNLKGKVKEISTIKYKAKDSFGIVLKDGIYKDKYSSLSDFEETINFNKKGFTTDITKYNDGILLSKENIIQDSLYRKIGSNKFNSNNKLTGKLVFKYNENGNISEMNSYDNNGEIELKWIYVYEENKMTRNNYNSDGSKYSSYISTYNDKGELIEYEHLNYEESKFNYTHNYSYDKIKNTKTEIHKSHYSLEFEDTKWFYRYNKAGDIIEEILDDYYLTKYQYEYDEYNNWTKQIEFSNGFPEFIIERKINYYN